MAEEGPLDPILQNVVGRTCDLCGEVCESTQELNLLDCTFEACSQAQCCYHQDCLERFLKSIRCERNRKTGFKCPRGSSKTTSYDKPCPGKIDKSHPIHPRAEATKRRKKAAVPPPPPPPTKPAAKPAAKPAESKPVVPAAAPAKPASPAKPVVTPAAAKPAAVPAKAAAALTANAKAAAAAKAAVMTREALAAAAASMRRELGLGGGIGGGVGSASGQRAAPEPQQSLYTQFAPAPPPTRESSTGLSMRDFLPKFVDPAPAPPQQPPASQAAAAASGNAWAARPAAVQRAPPPPPPPPPPPRGVFDANPGWPPGGGAAGPAAGFSPAPPPMLSWSAPPASNGAQYAPPPAVGAYGGGGWAADDDDDDDGGFSDPKSRAARKGERKRDKRRAAGLEPPPDVAAAVLLAPASVTQRLTATLVARKTALLAHQLAPMGFPPALCAAAVRRHGVDLDSAASWLLEASASGSDAAGDAVADIPVHDELAAVDDIAALCGCARDHVAEVVILAGGDLDATVLAIMEPAAVRAMPMPLPPPPQQQRASSPPPQGASALWGGTPRGLASARGGWPVPEQPRTPPQEPTLLGALQAAPPVSARGAAFVSAASEAAAAQPRQAQSLAPLAPQPRDESRFARNFSSNSLSGFSAHALGGSGSGFDLASGGASDDAVGRYPPPGFSAQSAAAAGGLFSGAGNGGPNGAGGLFAGRSAVGGGSSTFLARGSHEGGLGPLAGSNVENRGSAASLGAFSGLGLSAFSSDPLASAFRTAPPGFSGGSAAAAQPAGESGLWGAQAASSARPRLSRLAGYGVSAADSSVADDGAVPQAALLAAAAVADGKSTLGTTFRPASGAPDELSSLLATLMRGR